MGREAESEGSFLAARGQRRGVSLLVFLLLLLTILALVASCIVLDMCLREGLHSAMCIGKLTQIGRALCDYHVKHGAFPPAHLCDKTGKPINSWRTLIVPGYLGGDPLTAYDFAKPWNNPENSRLVPRTWDMFRCPSAGSEEPRITNYVAVVGPNTMWPGCKPAKQAADGSDKDKILVIEVTNSDILWMEPRDLTLEQALDAIQPKTGIYIGSRDRDGIHYVTVGGEVRTLAPNIDRESLRKLLVRDTPEASLSPAWNHPDTY